MRGMRPILALAIVLLIHFVDGLAESIIESSIFKPKESTNKERSIVAALLMMMSTDLDFLDRVIVAVSKHFITQTRSKRGSTVYKRLILQVGGSGEYRRDWTYASMTNMCYALSHDTPYILEYEKVLVPKGLPRHTTKIITLQKYLPFSDVILWLDLDTVILDTSAQLFHIPEKYKNSNVILLDHSKAINDGVFFIRKCPWSFEFLSETMAILKAMPYILFADNGALYFAIKNDCSRLNLYPHCKTIRMNPDLPHDTLNDYFACAKLAYNKREQVGRFALLSSEEYRINVWYLENYYDWDIRDTHREGDTIVHTKLMSTFVNVNNAASKCLGVKDFVWMNLLEENRDIYDEVLSSI